MIAMDGDPLVTIAVPSYNQGQCLDDALTSIFQQDVPVEVFVVDGGSMDGTLEVIRKWEPRPAHFHRPKFADVVLAAIADGKTGTPDGSVHPASAGFSHAC